MFLLQIEKRKDEVAGKGEKEGPELAQTTFLGTCVFISSLIIFVYSG